MSYIIKSVSESEITLKSALWENIQSIAIDKINWPELYPASVGTNAKIVHNDKGIYVKFECDEHPVHVNFKYHNGDVYQDSTVEFFIAPDKNSCDYFNFEINAEGYALIGYGAGRDRKRFADIDFSQFNIVSDINENGFELLLFVPYSFIKEYAKDITKEIKCNLQKCCEVPGYIHYLSAYPIKTDEPEFHAPQFFSDFVLE